jgi:hypothetical protein
MAPCIRPWQTRTHWNGSAGSCKVYKELDIEICIIAHNDQVVGQFLHLVVLQDFVQSNGQSCLGTKPPDRIRFLFEEFSWQNVFGKFRVVLLTKTTNLGEVLRRQCALALTVRIILFGHVEKGSNRDMGLAGGTTPNGSMIRWKGYPKPLFPSVGYCGRDFQEP